MYIFFQRSVFYGIFLSVERFSGKKRNRLFLLKFLLISLRYNILAIYLVNLRGELLVFIIFLLLKYSFNAFTV